MKDPKRYMVPKEDGNGFIVVDEPTEEQQDIIHVPELGQYPARPQRTTAHLEGSYSDRAKAFNHTTLNLALVTGLCVMTAAMVLRDSITFAALTGYFFGGFLVVWLISFILHTFVSAEGAELLETLFLWKFLFNEQKERHRRYQPSTDERPLAPFVLRVTVLLILFVLFVATMLSVEGGR